MQIEIVGLINNYWYTKFERDTRLCAEVRYGISSDEFNFSHVRKCIVVKMDQTCHCTTTTCRTEKVKVA